MSDLKKHIKILKQNTKITPKLLGWLNKNDGIHTDDPVILEKVLAILAPTKGDRSGHFHPSQLYQCQRKQIFEFYGMKADKRFNPTLQNLFNDGHFRHLRWQIMLLNAGILTDIEVGVGIEEYRLGGSMDGVNADEGWVFELKGTSQFASVQRSGVMAPHRKQIQAYLLASGYDTAYILYEDKSSQQWAEFEVPRDPQVIAEIESILKSLNAAIDGKEMPEPYDNCKNQTGGTFDRCPFSDVCLGFTSAGEVAQAVQIASGASAS